MVPPNKPLHFCRGLFFAILHNGVYYQNVHNISRKIWTSSTIHCKIYTFPIHLINGFT